MFLFMCIQPSLDKKHHKSKCFSNMLNQYCQNRATNLTIFYRNREIYAKNQRSEGVTFLSKKNRVTQRIKLRVTL